METVWDWLTFFWDEGMKFLSFKIDVGGLNFTLWEFAFGSVIIVLILRFIFRDT